MKRAVQFTGIFITIVITLFYLASCLAPYISPLHIPVLTLFSLAYLPLLVLYVMVIIAWLFIKRKIALLLVVVLLLGYKSLTSTVGFNVISPAWDWKKDTTTTRVMCWNVNFLGDPYLTHDKPDNTRRKMLSYIREVRPDILCLQDFTSIVEGTTKGVFFKNLESVYSEGGFSAVYYPYFYEHNGANYSIQNGVVIFSRLPIVDSGSFRTNGANPDETAGYADIMMAGRPVRLFGAHLSSMQLWPSESGKAGLNFLKGDSTRLKTTTILSKLAHFGKQHATEASIIKKEMNKSPYPVILSADLNSVPSGYVYHTVRSGLKDAFLEKDFGIGGTYHMVFPKLRIDYLLHSSEIEVVQYTRPAIKLSDHYPIIADIRWKK